MREHQDLSAIKDKMILGFKEAFLCILLDIIFLRIINFVYLFEKLWEKLKNQSQPLTIGSYSNE